MPQWPTCRLLCGPLPGTIGFVNGGCAWLAATATAIAVAGCYDSPTYVEGLGCTETGQCPPGQTCHSDEQCRFSGLPVDVSLTSNSDDPLLIWSGSELALVWTNPPYTRLARVTAAGDVLDTWSFRPPGEARDPSVVWTGSQYALTWQSDDAYFALVDGDGAMGEPTRVSEGGEANDPAVTAAGDSFVMAWLEYAVGSSEGPVRAGVLDGNGQLLTRVAVAGPMSAAVAPSIAWLGASAAIAYSEGGRQYVVCMDMAGNLGSPVDLGESGQLGHGAGLVATDVGFAITWSGDYAVRFALLNADCTLSFSREVAGASDSRADPALAWTGTGFGVAWHSGDVPQIYLAELDAAGADVAPPAQVTHLEGRALRARLAWTGTGFALAWQHEGARFDVYLDILTR